MTREEAEAKAHHIRDRCVPSSERFSGLVDAIATALLSAAEEERAACEAVAREAGFFAPRSSNDMTAVRVNASPDQIADAIAARSTSRPRAP